MKNVFIYFLFNGRKVPKYALEDQTHIKTFQHFNLQINQWTSDLETKKYKVFLWWTPAFLVK